MGFSFLLELLLVLAVFVDSDVFLDFAVMTRYEDTGFYFTQRNYFFLPFLSTGVSDCCVIISDHEHEYNGEASLSIGPIAHSLIRRS